MNDRPPGWLVALTWLTLAAFLYVMAGCATMAAVARIAQTPPDPWECERAPSWIRAQTAPTPRLGTRMDTIDCGSAHRAWWGHIERTLRR